MDREIIESVAREKRFRMVPGKGELKHEMEQSSFAGERYGGWRRPALQRITEEKWTHRLRTGKDKRNCNKSIKLLIRCGPALKKRWL